MAPNPSKTTKANARKATKSAISGLGTAAAPKEGAQHGPKIIRSKSNLALLKAREAFNAAGVDIAPWPVPKQD